LFKLFDGTKHIHLLLLLSVAGNEQPMLNEDLLIIKGLVEKVETCLLELRDFSSKEKDLKI